MVSPAQLKQYHVVKNYFNGIVITIISLVREKGEIKTYNFGLQESNNITKFITRGTFKTSENKPINRNIYQSLRVYNGKQIFSRCRSEERNNAEDKSLTFREYSVLTILKSLVYPVPA